MGPRRDAFGVKADDEESVGAPRAKAYCEGKETLRVALSVRFHSSLHRRSPLAHPSHGQRGGLLLGALSLRQREIGASKDQRILLVLDQAGWHTGKEAEVPEGIHLEFLPARSPELQPAERLWPLANEAVANRLFEDLSQLEETLAERCVALLEQTELIRSLTLYHWWPDAA